MKEEKINKYIVKNAKPRKIFTLGLLFFAFYLFSSAAMSLSVCFGKLEAEEKRRAKDFIDKSEGNVCHKSLMHKKIENSIEEKKIDSTFHYAINFAFFISLSNAFL